MVKDGVAHESRIRKGSSLDGAPRKIKLALVQAPCIGGYSPACHLTSPRSSEKERLVINNMTVSRLGSNSRHLCRNPVRSPKLSITHFIWENFVSTDGPSRVKISRSHARESTAVSKGCPYSLVGTLGKKASSYCLSINFFCSINPKWRY
jgi:hypothetical protein